MGAAAGGVAASAAEAAIGFGIARELGQQAAGSGGGPAGSAGGAGEVVAAGAETLPAPVPVAASEGVVKPDLLSPAQAAELLGVGEADVGGEPGSGRHQGEEDRGDLARAEEGN